MTNLTNTKNQGLATLDTEQKTIAPQYYDKRNQVSTTNDLAAKNFAEFMANRGGSSGTSAQANLLNNSALQNNIGSLNKQELTANQGIATKKTDLNTTYDNNVLGVNNNYQSNLADRYATIDSNAASLIAQYIKEQEAAKQAAALAAQQQAVAQQQAQVRAQAAAQKKAENTTTSHEQPNAVFQSAISSASDAAANGQLAAWVQANASAMTENLSAQERAALKPGGFIYHQLLKGD